MASSVKTCQAFVSCDYRVSDELPSLLALPKVSRVQKNAFSSGVCFSEVISFSGRAAAASSRRGKSLWERMCTEGVRRNTEQMQWKSKKLHFQKVQLVTGSSAAFWLLCLWGLWYRSNLPLCVCGGELDAGTVVREHLRDGTVSLSAIGAWRDGLLLICYDSAFIGLHST